MSIADLTKKAERQDRNLRRLGVIILTSVAALSLLTNVVVGIIFYTTEDHASDQRNNLIGQVATTRRQLDDSRHSVDMLSAETEALRKQLNEAGLKPVEVAPVPPTSSVPKRTTTTSRSGQTKSPQPDSTQPNSTTTTTNKPSNSTTTTSTTQPRSPPTTRCVILTLGCSQET